MILQYYINIILYENVKHYNYITTLFINRLIAQSVNLLHKVCIYIY